LAFFKTVSGAAPVSTSTWWPSACTSAENPHSPVPPGVLISIVDRMVILRSPIFLSAIVCWAAERDAYELTASKRHVAIVRESKRDELSRKREGLVCGMQIVAMWMEKSFQV
jgi:hypothetical protein